MCDCVWNATKRENAATYDKRKKKKSETTEHLNGNGKKIPNKSEKKQKLLTKWHQFLMKGGENDAENAAQRSRQRKKRNFYTHRECRQHVQI